MYMLMVSVFVPVYAENVSVVHFQISEAKKSLTDYVEKFVTGVNKITLFQINV